MLAMTHLLTFSICADGRLDLPSPIPSDSGSLNSFMRAPELPGVSNLSPDSSPVPALGPERSDRDMALSGSIGDGEIADGITLSCDEDLGWVIPEASCACGRATLHKGVLSNGHGMILAGRRPFDEPLAARTPCYNLHNYP